MTSQYVAATDGEGILSVTTLNFEHEVGSADRLVLVDFYSMWCTRCKPVMHMMEQFAREHEDSLKVVKVNIDGNEALWEKCGCRTIPAVVAMMGGEVMGMVTGSVSKGEVANLVRKTLQAVEAGTAGDLALEGGAA